MAESFPEVALADGLKSPETVVVIVSDTLYPPVVSGVECYPDLPTPTASPCCGVCTIEPPGGDEACSFDYKSSLEVFYWPVDSVTLTPAPSIATLVSGGYTL